MANGLLVSVCYEFLRRRGEPLLGRATRRSQALPAIRIQAYAEPTERLNHRSKRYRR